MNQHTLEYLQYAKGYAATSVMSREQIEDELRIDVERIAQEYVRMPLTPQVVKGLEGRLNSFLHSQILTGRILIEKNLRYEYEAEFNGNVGTVSLVEYYVPPEEVEDEAHL